MTKRPDELTARQRAVVERVISRATAKSAPPHRVLFAGAAATGKTMDAQSLASLFDVDIHRVDLSQVVSKYIGETEKRIERVFADAAGHDAILFIDEGDALFGERSEAKDAHDRYANQEVSYLLARMEKYEGLVILTTNHRAAIDAASSREGWSVVDLDDDTDDDDD